MKRLAVLTATGALCTAAVKAPERAYRWRSLGESGQVTGVVLPSKGAQVVMVVDGKGEVLRDPGHPDRIPMDRVTGVAVGDYAPEVIVAVGEASTGGNVRFSLDGGQTWRPCPNPPDQKGGALALSSLGKIWVWKGSKGAYRTDDYGFRWEVCEGLQTADVEIVADRTSSRRFYAFAGRRLFVSEDGAKSFSEREVVLPGGSDIDSEVRNILPAPGRAGDLWLLTRQALYRSVPGKPYVRIAGVTDPAMLSFGLARLDAAPGPTRFTVFLVGTVLGRQGLFRSDDEGFRWTPLAGAPSPQEVAGLYGDRQRAQSVYLARAGGGLLEGRPR